MKVNFAKIIIKDIEGRDVQADFQRQLGNQLYMQGRDIEECELGKRIAVLGFKTLQPSIRLWEEAM